MRAAVFHGPRDVRIESVPDPAAPAPGEVVLEVIRAAICGTDASEWDHGPVLCRPGRRARARVRRARRRARRRRHGPARRRPGRLRGRDLVRPLPLVSRPSHEPVRRVPHARSSGGRRAGRVRDVAGGDLPCRSRRVRRRRGCDGAAAGRRAPRALSGRAGPGRRRRGDRSRRHRLVHRRGRIAARGRRTRRRDRHRRRAAGHRVARSGRARPRTPTGARSRRAAARAQRRRRLRRRDRGQRRASRTRRRRSPARAAAGACSSSACTARRARSTSPR